jgi:DNA-binding GntR family transcriptional regulator
VTAGKHATADKHETADKHGAADKHEMTEKHKSVEKHKTTRRRCDILLSIMVCVREPMRKRLSMSISEQIHEHLRSEIMDCTLMPGDRILVQEVAGRFGVSQAPVRDALEKLKQDNLVDARPNRGVVVSQITRQKMQELFDVRVLMEGYAVRRALRHIGTREIIVLDRLVDEMANAVDTGDKWGAAMADLKFHGYLYGLCDNHVVQDTWARIQDNMIRYMNISQRRLPMDNLIPAHRALVDVLRQGDADRTEAAFLEHIGSSFHIEILEDEAPPQQ